MVEPIFYRIITRIRRHLVAQSAYNAQVYASKYVQILRRTALYDTPRTRCALVYDLVFTAKFRHPKCTHPHNIFARRQN